MTRIFLVLLFISLSGFGLARQNSPKNDFEAALEAMDREDQEAAFFHLENWLKSYPQDALAHWYMGQVYESFPGENTPFALEYYNQAINLNPQLASAYFSRGRIFLQMERFEAAEKDFLTFQNLPKGETNQIFFEKNSTQAGVSGIFTLQGNLSAKVFYHLGLCQMGMENYEKANDYFDQAIEIRPEPDYLTEKSQALLSLDRSNEAESALITALEIDPDHFLAQERLALIRGKNPEELIEPLNIAVKNKPNEPQVWKKRGYYFLERGNWKLAERDLREALALDNQDAELYLYLGTIASRQQEWAQAEKYFSEGLFLDETNTQIILARGQARYQQSKLEEALADFIQLIGIDPTLPTAYYHRGITLLRMKRNQEACENLQLAANWGMEAAQEVIKKACQD
ncbi:tetratricopeptide repeat protein [Algoriphagus marincola]|uniref:Tetratricopeptide repeat protein n=1 Tax=Algoriphagus marincola TaxID=264027 RepID=A0ABS7N595_9BACT|nr:tetratricopeptide repeat protein [Algoriphagus marincola]MBY5951509.1 tetratricopeptide repeat protein [Algoriphagus marincola]